VALHLGFKKDAIVIRRSPCDNFVVVGAKDGTAGVFDCKVVGQFKLRAVLKTSTGTAVCDLCFLSRIPRKAKRPAPKPTHHKTFSSPELVLSSSESTVRTDTWMQSLNPAELKGQAWFVVTGHEDNNVRVWEVPDFPDDASQPVELSPTLEEMRNLYVRCAESVPSLVSHNAVV